MDSLQWPVRESVLRPTELALIVTAWSDGLMIWDLRPGDKIRRVDLHRSYGGSGQGGIGPSAQSPNIFIFSDPSSGERHGYFDRWEDGELHYAGAGQPHHGDPVKR